MDLQVQFSKLKEGQEKILQMLQESRNAKSELKVYSLSDLAKFFGVTTRTIYNWKEEGRLPLTIVGSKSYMTEVQLQAFLEKYEVKPLKF